MDRLLALMSSSAIVSFVGLLPVGCSSSNGTTPNGDAGADSSAKDAAIAETGVSADTGTSPDASGANDSGAVATNVLYVETNDVTPGNNAVLAYARASDGSLTALPGGPFMTGGTGVGNPTQSLGPDDTDQEIASNAERTLLFAVNAGSNTIAVFHIAPDGTLTPVQGSPFPSGGISPVSVGVAGQYLYVVNQDEDPAQDAGAGAANYTAFAIGTDGSLTAVPNSTVAAGASPSVALVSPSGNLLFGADFLAPLKSVPAQPPLRAFAIGSNGTLTAAPGTPMAIPVVDGGSPPGTPVALGLAVHPTQNILYVDFPLRSQVGVYTFDGTTGALTYVTEASVSGPAPCWTRISRDGTKIYVTDTGNDSVSVLDSTTPLAPAEIQNLQLDDTGPASDAGATASESYEEALSPDGKFLYVLSQRTTTDPNVTAGNVLHVLSVGSDGKLTETVSDVKLQVTTGSRPQGVVVF